MKTRPRLNSGRSARLVLVPRRRLLEITCLQSPLCSIIFLRHELESWAQPPPRSAGGAEAWILCKKSLDAMQQGEALELIAKGLPAPSTQGRKLMELTARLGEWPLLLKLVNGFLRDRVVKLKQALPPAIAAVNKRLDEKGLVAFDKQNQTDRSKAVALTIGVSLEAESLGKFGKDRFTELGTFPEDSQIPIGIVEALWRGHLDGIETENLLSELSRCC